VLAEAAKRAPVSISFSIPTLDPEVWRKTEPGTAPPRQRLRAVRQLADAGVSAGVNIAPVLPGLSDRPEQIEAVVKAAKDAGAAHIWCNTLRLGPGTREHFMNCLARDWPELVDQYEDLYTKPSPPGWFAKPITSLADSLKRRYDIGENANRLIRPAPEPEQLALFRV
jgi:DNA repair photolyase